MKYIVDLYDEEYDSLGISLPCGCLLPIGTYIHFEAKRRDMSAVVESYQFMADKPNEITMIGRVPQHEADRYFTQDE